jgi:hypothetical protein
MNRRGFLGLAAAIAAGATLDPDRLLWVQGKKLISIPMPVVPVPVEIQASTFSAWNVGDILTFGQDPTRYIVTKIHPPGGRVLLELKLLRGGWRPRSTVG